MALGLHPGAPMSDAARKGRILVVDDEPSARSALEKLLTSEGYSVNTAGDGAEAVPDYLLREAQDRVALPADDGGLLFRVRPPGAQPHVFAVHPGPGCVYDPLAQKILRNLLCPDAPAP